MNVGMPTSTSGLNLRMKRRLPSVPTVLPPPELTINAPLIGLFITVALNFGALVWAASSFKSDLNHLSDALDRLSFVLDRLDSKVQDHESRLRVLEDRPGRGHGHGRDK